MAPRNCKQELLKIIWRRGCYKMLSAEGDVSAIQVVQLCRCAQAGQHGYQKELKHILTRHEQGATQAQRRVMPVFPIK
jgi:hypothetical protein